MPAQLPQLPLLLQGQLQLAEQGMQALLLLQLLPLLLPLLFSLAKSTQLLHLQQLLLLHLL